MELFRINKKPRGYIVEVCVSKWYFFGLKKVWKPYITSAGLDCAWHHQSYEHALINLIDKVKNDVKINPL
jgi:hypothetical protein